MNVEQLLEAALKDPKQRGKFIESLMSSRIFVIGENNIQVTADGVEVPMVNLLTMSREDGERCVPFFTSIARLNFFNDKMSQGEAPYLETTAIDLFKTLAAQKSAAVINPNSEYSKQFSVEEITAIIKVIVGAEELEKSLNSGETVVIGEPAAYPIKLSNALKSYFKKCTEVVVNKAYLLTISHKNIKPHIFLVVDFEGESDTFFPKIQEVALPFLKDETDIVDVVKLSEQMEKEVVNDKKPFYSKS